MRQELVGLLDAAYQGSFQQAMLAPMCDKEKVLQHRTLPAGSALEAICGCFRARWHSILRNCALDAQQQARLRCLAQTAQECACDINSACWSV